MFRHGIELLRLGEEPVTPIGQALELASSKAAKSLFLLCPKSSGIQTAHQKKKLIMWEGFMHDHGAGLRCDCAGDRRCGGLNGCDEADLIDGQMDGTIVRACAHRDVAIRGKTMVKETASDVAAGNAASTESQEKTERASTETT